MTNFHHTVMGHRFFEVTLPDLALQTKRIANALERLVDAVERERAPWTEAKGAGEVDATKKEGG